MRLAVIGAGHAGVEAARVAGEAGAEVLLFSGETVLPYYRPRLVALAFGQVEADAIAMHPAAWYAERRIQLLLDTPISSWSPRERTLQGGGRNREADRIVLASGSLPLVPPWAASCPDGILPLWTVRQAQHVRAHVRGGSHVVVVGGGILGIETALRAQESGLRVTIVERMVRLMPAQFGDRASRILLNRLTAKGIRILLGRMVQSASRESGRLAMTLDDAQKLDADFSVLTIGAQPDLTLARMAGLKVERGVFVDATLRTSVDTLFAAGDVVQLEGIMRCSVRESTVQGKVAGLNAMASAQGSPLQPHTPTTSPLAFKSNDLEVYSLGRPSGTGEVVLDGSTESIFRSLVVQDGVTVGVQMIGTRQGLDEYAGTIGKRIV